MNGPRVTLPPAMKARALARMRQRFSSARELSPEQQERRREAIAKLREPYRKR